MTAWGYTLSSEEHGPRELVGFARQAEAAGFDFLTISDHFHPWLQSQGHSPFVWTTLGALATSTERIPIGTGVTCPIQRTHPAIIAHAAATAAVMLPGRFFLGVGTGEALNEHVTGERWPAIEVRREMLAEAVEIMRALWTGETIDHWGTYFTVENARLFTVPDDDIAVIVSGMGEQSARLAGEIGDGLWATAPDESAVKAFQSAGGNGPTYGQLTVCWGPDEDAAVDTAHRIWANAGVPGQLSQDLPTWTHFEQAASLVTPEMIRRSMPCGPDLDRIVEGAKAYVDAGFTHVHIHQIGPDQEGFLARWSAELGDALRAL